MRGNGVCALQGSGGQECGSSGQDHHDQMYPLHPLYQVRLALSFLSCHMLESSFSDAYLLWAGCSLFP